MSRPDRPVLLPAPPRGGPPRADGETALDDELEETIRRAWELLIPRADEIADQISARLLINDPLWFEQADPALRADVHQNTREHVRRGLLTLAGRGDADHRTTDVWRETGRKRARQGVAMELVLNAYTLGTRILWETLLELDAPDLDLDDHLLLVAGQRLWHALDVQNAVLIDAHRRESARLARRDLQRQQGLLDRLVEGGGSDPAFANEAASALGVGPDEPVACVAAPFDSSLEEPLRAVDDRLDRGGRVSYWHVRGGTQFGLVPASGLDERQLVDLLRPAAAGRVGVAVARDGLAGFGTAYQLAVRAAQSVPRGVVDVVVVTDRLPELLLSATPEVTSLLVEETVGPLLRLNPHQSEVLLQTLAVLIRCNVSPSRSAEELYCHRNTVLYRLKQIEQLTGRDLHVPRDRLMLALGLMATGRSIGPGGSSPQPAGRPAATGPGRSTSTASS